MKKNLLYTTAVIFALIMSGCNDFLDKIPDNRAELDDVQTVSELITASYPKNHYACFLNPRVDYIVDKGPGQTMANVNTDSFYWNDVRDTDRDTPDGFWNNAYFAIACANHAIEAGAKLYDQKSIEPYMAEAKVSRAFTHFLLVNIFSKMYVKDGDNSSYGIPYVVEPETIVFKDYERGSVASTYDKIEKDMLEGIEKLGPDNIYHVPKYHFTRDAANTFASRFYLYKGEWSKVIQHVNTFFPTPSKFINTGTGAGNVASNDNSCAYAKINLMKWQEMAGFSSSSRVSRMFCNSTTSANLLITETSSLLGRRYNSWRYATTTDVLRATIHANNVTGGTWLYKSWGNSTEGYMSVPKFYEHFVKTSIDANIGLPYIMFVYLRQDEALINRAEAYAMLDNYDMAIADLNIFCRFKITNYNENLHNITMEKLVNFYKSLVESESHYMNVYNAYGSSAWSVEKKALIQCILDFRRNEFMHESLRYWDMIRYKIPVTHTDYYGESNTLYPDDDRWVIQIPEAATLSNVPLNPREKLLSPDWKPKN